MNSFDRLQIMVCLDDTEKAQRSHPDSECEDAIDLSYTEGWLAAAKMALFNSQYLFSNQRDAVEVLFRQLADEEDGDSFVETMMDVLDFSDEDNLRRGSAWDDDTLSLGARGEDAAVRCLESKGYVILERNYVCRFGEADIIAQDPEGTIVFIEVKTRRSNNAGIPEEAITASKRRRYENIAMEYMSCVEGFEDGTPVRFDAIGICVKGHNRAMLRHHIGCFDARY